MTRLHQHAACSRHADGVARDEAYKSRRAVMEARALGKLPLSRLFFSHLHTHRAAYHLAPPSSHARTAFASCAPPQERSTHGSWCPHNHARTTAKKAAAATALRSSNRAACARGINGRTGKSACSAMTSATGCCRSGGCCRSRCTPAAAVGLQRQASKRCSTAPTVLHGTREWCSTTTKGAPAWQRGRTGMRHGRTHRKVSWFSDDICDGMLPVRRL